MLTLLNDFPDFRFVRSLRFNHTSEIVVDRLPPSVLFCCFVMSFVGCEVLQFTFHLLKAHLPSSCF